MTYNLLAEMNESTVVARYVREEQTFERYQSEAALEQDFIERLSHQGYEYLPIHSEGELIANLRAQLEALNHIEFTAAEWSRFLNECICAAGDSATDKTARLQTDPVQVLHRDDGTTKNIVLLDKRQIHNNILQVINQYVQEGGTAGSNRYDVTILVNGLPMVHVELKRRGVPIKEAFNQINRYERDSFWAGSGLYDYVQIFVISNGTHTKYYSNTTRREKVAESQGRRTKATSRSFEFTSWWADGSNKIIEDLADFTQTFFARHAILAILTRYCVFTAGRVLLVMRPYQIAATEKIINQIEIAHNYKLAGSIDAGGYIWHTTGSGKTLTSFKTAQIASRLEYIDKVLFVVDRKDLDYQTMTEYDRFEKGAASSNASTAILKGQLEDPEARIIVTTIQKLDHFVRKYKGHPVFDRQVVIIFDECHRSQFGDMHEAITKAFKHYYLFGFTGTPIFPENAASGSRTTEQIFGKRLHTYTIVDAINDGNVLPFRIDYISTMRKRGELADTDVPGIDTQDALLDPKRISGNVSYVLEHFDQKTFRNTYYSHEGKRLNGFNSIFAAESIPAAMRYYEEFKRQIAEGGLDLRVAIIYSQSSTEENPEGAIPDESFDTDGLSLTQKEFLDRAMDEYNKTFKSQYDSSSDKAFENYYKDISKKMRDREIDILIVVNMFLTGFDAPTLNTLWVDKNLRMHGLLQAFSRTNRILNSVKAFGNIVCFRNLEENTDEALALFGDKEARGIAVLAPFEHYYDEYEKLAAELLSEYPLGEEITGEERERSFVGLYGKMLRLLNILRAFDSFAGRELLSEGQMQQYQGMYIDLYQQMRHPRPDGERINDDLIFEMELVKQVEVNIDYILMLVARYHDSHMEDRDILDKIERAMSASSTLRSKRELIEAFIDQMNPEPADIDISWRDFVARKRVEELDEIIRELKLDPERTHAFMDDALRDGTVKTTGTDIDKILPPLSRFGGGRDRAKHETIERLQAYCERFAGLG